MSYTLAMYQLVFDQINGKRMNDKISDLSMTLTQNK